MGGKVTTVIVVVVRKVGTYAVSVSIFMKVDVWLTEALVKASPSLLLLSTRKDTHAGLRTSIRQTRANIAK